MTDAFPLRQETGERTPSHLPLLVHLMGRDGGGCLSTGTVAEMDTRLIPHPGGWGVSSPSTVISASSMKDRINHQTAEAPSLEKGEGMGGGGFPSPMKAE